MAGGPRAPARDRGRGAGRSRPHPGRVRVGLPGPPRVLRGGHVLLRGDVHHGPLAARRPLPEPGGRVGFRDVGHGRRHRHDRRDLPHRHRRRPLLLHPDPPRRERHSAPAARPSSSCSSATPPRRAAGSSRSYEAPAGRSSSPERRSSARSSTLRASGASAAASTGPASPTAASRPRLRRLLADADALVTTWDSPRFGEELLSLAPRLRLVAHCGGEVKARFARPLFERLMIANAPGPMAHLVAELAVTFLLMAARRVDAYREALRRPSNRVYERLHLEGAGPETLRETDRRPPGLRADRPGDGAPPAALRPAPARPRPVRGGRHRARQGRHAGDARPPPARVRVPRPRRRAHRRDARPPRPRRPAPPARRRHRRERGPRRRSWTSTPSPRRSDRAGSAAPSTSRTRWSPSRVRHPLRRMRGAILTPHVGAAAVEVRRAMADIVLDALERFFRGERVKTRVTPAHAGADDMIRLAFSTLGCPSWPLARVLDDAGRLGLRRRRAALRRGRRRALGPARAHGLRPPGDARPPRRRRPRRPLRRHALLLPQPRPRRPAPGRRGGGAHGRGRGRGWGRAGIRVFGDRVQPGADLASTRRWIVESLGRPARSPPRHRRRGLARDARRLRDRRRHPRPAGRSGERGARRGVGPGQRLLGVRRGARGRRRGARPLPAPRPPQGRAAPARRQDPVAPGPAGPRRLPGRARARAGCRRRAATAGSPSSGRSAGTRRSRSRRWRSRTSSAGPRTSCGGDARRSARARGSSPAAACASEVFPSRPMMGVAAARAVAEAIRDLLARDGRAAVIFASAPSQNEFLAALRRGARDRLAEAHRLPPRRVRRHRPRPPRLLPPLPRRPALRPREGRRVPRPRRPGAGPRRGVRALRRAPAAGEPRPSPSSGSGRTATSPSSTRRSATSPSGRT